MSGARQERLERLHEGYRQITNDENEVAKRARDAARRALETGEARQARLQQRQESSQSFGDCMVKLGRPGSSRGGRGMLLV